MSRARHRPITQHTRAPMIYVTGGQHDRGNAAECCDLAAIPDNAPWPQAMNGGPIDAPDWMPTGAATSPLPTGSSDMLTITACWNHGCRIFATLHDGRTVAYTGEFDTTAAAAKMAAQVGDFGRIASLNWREMD